MCRGAQHPGRHVKSRPPDPTAPARVRSPTFPVPALSAVSSRQVALNSLSWLAVKRLLQNLGRLRPVDRTKEFWSLRELGMAGEIGQGRTGRVYEGCINSQQVAVKVR